MRIRALHLGITLVLVSGTMAYATLGTDAGRDDARAAKAAGKSGPHLTARGYVVGLYPGAVKRIRVRVRNPYSDPVTLRVVTTRVSDGAPGCTGENLAVERLRTHARIRPHKARGVRINVSMLSSAPDACQGANFPLRFKLWGKRR